VPPQAGRFSRERPIAILQIFDAYFDMRDQSYPRLAACWVFGVGPLKLDGVSIPLHIPRPRMAHMLVAR
jgi:hypothetical protein